MVQALLTQLHIDDPQHGLALIGAKEDTGVSEYAGQEWTGPE
jgi:hypothetical protein